MRIVANYEESLNNVSSQLKQSFYCFECTHSLTYYAISEKPMM